MATFIITKGPHKGERRCARHPNYIAIGKPHSACEWCWMIYFGISETCQNCGCQENER